MPYIKQEDREMLQVDSQWALYWDASKPGELNYLFSKICAEYVKAKGLSYQTINDIVGALENAKQEFYRRVAVPYEDKKIQENGDVYQA